MIEADPVAARVRELMAERSRWTGNALDLLQGGASAVGDNRWRGNGGWPTSPRALAGRLRRAQTSLRTLGIEIAFSREGRAGTRIIRISASPKSKTDSTVSIVGNCHDDDGSGPRHPPGVEPIHQTRRQY